jgi:hypothetical protein
MIIFSWFGAGEGDPGYPAWYTFDSMYVFAVGLSKVRERAREREKKRESKRESE